MKDNGQQNAICRKCFSAQQGGTPGAVRRRVRMSWIGNIGIARFGIVVACALNVALMPKPAPAHMAVDASGMFINEQGGILTAEHAVAPCASVYAVYAGQVSRAELVARDSEQDLALLRSALVPFLPAVFAR